MSTPVTAPQPSFLPLLGVGLVGGLFAGVFGVGGGLIMVPLLLWWTTMGHKRAHATSLLAITPAAIAGAVAYGIGGVFEWEIALLVALGAVIGAQVGALLLRTTKVTILRWGFIAFVVFSAAGLLFQVPNRETELEITLMVGLFLFVVGLGMGVSAGLFGVGGGVIVIPVLVLFFGQSDLLAKGVSLLAMAPGSISGSIAHMRHKTASLRDGAWVALGAVLTAPVGALCAFALSPKFAAYLFAGLLFFIASTLIIKALRSGKAP